MYLGSDGKALNVKLLSVEGKFVQANEYGKSMEDEVQIELTEEEKAMASQMRQVWNEILKSRLLTTQISLLLVLDLLMLCVSNLDLKELIQNLMHL